MSNVIAMPKVARILSRFDRERLAGFLDVALALIDMMDGDAEAEAETRESDGDDQDFAWIEWATLHGEQASPALARAA
jgi:hypothetical protein